MKKSLILCFLFVFAGSVVHLGLTNKKIKLEKVAVSNIPADIFVPGLGSIRADKKGDYFVYAGRYELDKCFVIKLDTNLKYLKTFGRYGKGPGEFTTDMSSVDGRLTLDEQGNVYVLDNNPFKLVKFDNNGKFIKEIDVSRSYPQVVKSGFNFVGKDHYIALKHTLQQSSNPDKNPPVGILASFPESKIFFKYQFTEKRIFIKTGNTITMGVRHDFFGDNMFVETNGHQVLFGNSQIYRFKLIDLGGRTLFEHHQSDKRMGEFDNLELQKLMSEPIMFGGKSWEKSFAENRTSHYNKLKNQIKGRKNVISRFFLTKERIFVFRVPKNIRQKISTPVDVFDLTGKLFGEFECDFIPHLIVDNFFLRIIENEKGDPILEKYKIPYN